MTRTVTLAAALAFTAAACAGCGPTTAGTPTGSGPTAAGSCHARAVPNGTLPHLGCTPGATDPHVTQASIDTTICRPGGYTSTVRPPEAVTSIKKRSALRAYNDTAPTATYELDHLVSLELGRVSPTAVAASATTARRHSPRASRSVGYRLLAS